MLTAIAETAKPTTTKIRSQLLLKDAMEAVAKSALGSSYSADLLHMIQAALSEN